jgi:hypothetical protein
MQGSCPHKSGIALRGNAVELHFGVSVLRKYGYISAKTDDFVKTKASAYKAKFKKGTEKPTP